MRGRQREADSERCYLENVQKMHRQRKCVLRSCVSAQCAVSKLSAHVTATETLRGSERQTARQREVSPRQRSGNAQTTEVCAKRAVSVLSALCQCSVLCVSVHVTATETLRGERVYANSGRIYGDNDQEMHRQRERRRQ